MHSKIHFKEKEMVISPKSVSPDSGEKHFSEKILVKKFKR